MRQWQKLSELWQPLSRFIFPHLIGEALWIGFPVACILAETLTSLRFLQIPLLSFRALINQSVRAQITNKAFAVPVTMG